MKRAARTHKPTTRELEKKFAETAFRLNQERNDFFLPQVRDFVREKKWMNLRPEYQRRQVWDDERRSLFIESLLLNVLTNRWHSFLAQKAHEQPANKPKNGSRNWLDGAITWLMEARGELIISDDDLSDAVDFVSTFSAALDAVVQQH